MKVAIYLTVLGKAIPPAVRTSTRQRRDENLVAMILSAISNQRMDVKGISRASLVKQMKVAKVQTRRALEGVQLLSRKVDRRGAAAVAAGQKAVDRWAARVSRHRKEVVVARGMLQNHLISQKYKD